MHRLFLLLAAVLFAAPARAEWWEARTDHFIVYSESNAQDAKAFAEKLERFDNALRALQGIKFQPITSDSQRLTIFRFGDIGDIGRLAGSEGVAGFYIPRLGGSVAFTPAHSEIQGGSIIRRDRRTDLDPQSVLFHEYTHHFMFQYFPAAYPSWYIEGFAETAATIDLKPDGSFHVGNPPQYRSDALFGSILPQSAAHMLTDNGRPDFFDMYGHYTVGWLLNHYLSFDPSRKGQLTAYLKGINAGVEPALAARQAFGDLTELDRDLQRYKNSGRLGGADVVLPNYRPPTVAMRKLAPDEEAIMHVKVRSKRGVDRKSAVRVAADAREVAARYPRSFAVQLALSEAEFDAERYAEAERAVDAALAMQPQSTEALLRKGEIYLERGKTQKQYLSTARSWFAKAYATDHQHPGALFNNYLASYYEGGPLAESALIGLERAYELASYDGEVRLVLARQLLNENKGDIARFILLPLALNPHESKGAQALFDVIQLIKSNQIAQARAKLAAEMQRQEDRKKKGD